MVQHIRLESTAVKWSCFKQIVSLVAIGLVLVACAYTEASYPEKVHKNKPPIFRAPGEDVQKNSIFGPEGITLFDSRHNKTSQGIIGGVNSFLWRAALDTISFMPMSSVPDPFGGVIVTDWYAFPESPQERFKVNIYILSHELRSDGIKVSAFRQVRNQDGTWQDALLQVNTEIEDAILTRARQLRIAFSRR